MLYDLKTLQQTADQTHYAMNILLKVVDIMNKINAIAVK